MNKEKFGDQWKQIIPRGHYVKKDEVEAGGIYATLKYAKSKDSKNVAFAYGVMKLCDGSTDKIELSWNLTSKERWMKGGDYKHPEDGGKVWLFSPTPLEQRMMSDCLEAIRWHDNANGLAMALQQETERKKLLLQQSERETAERDKLRQQIHFIEGEYQKQGEARERMMKHISELECELIDMRITCNKSWWQRIMYRIGL